MTEPEKVNLKTMDIAENKREQLKALFPEVFAEDKIDFAQLKRVLGEWVEPGKERFGLNWHGKADCMKVIQQSSLATLKPSRDESVNFDETENLFIEGDNLEVLKLLQKSYFGKVKMIYIDPPYNTGKEFIYPDKFSETLETYLEYTGQKDENGRKFSTNTETDGRYHSNWLNMMYPRLYLAKNLLRDDGVIFISIDDHEQANLKALCDQIFGEENFVGEIVWHSKYTTSNDAKYISKQHEYVLFYARSIGDFEIGLLDRTEDMNASYKNPDNDPKGAWKATPLHAKSGSENNIYQIDFPNGRKWIAPQGRYPRYSEKRLLEIYKEGGLYFNKSGGIDKKTYLSEVKPGKTAGTLWSYQTVGSSHQSNEELAELLHKGMFNNPKPTGLLRTCLKVANLNQNDIILDFFAGSCTTAHAVMQLNAEDGGNRKYICAQLPEPTDEKSEAYKAGYKTIADIAKERIRRAGKKIADEKRSQLNLNHNCPLDLGFKVFKLTPSNFKVWESDPQKIENLEQQLFDHVDHIHEASTAEDILYELLLKSGFSLTTPVEKIQLAGKEVFSIEEGALLICLDKALHQEVMDAMADENPLQVICLDEGFNGNDQLKANAVQTFKARARRAESEIVFRTV